MKPLSVCCGIALAVSLMACDYNSRLAHKVDDLQRRIDSLTLELSRIDSLKLAPSFASDSWEYSFLSGQISGLQTQISQLQTDLWRVQYVQDSYKTAVFDATAPKGYQVLQTSAGQFLVALDEATPYLDGYRLRFEFGNPYSATFKGLEVTVKWGKSFDRFSKSASLNLYSKWQKSLRKKEASLTQDLEPATWNVVNITVSPAEPDQLSYIELAMTTKTVSLYKK
jgi:hypothetical protein